MDINRHRTLIHFISFILFTSSTIYTVFDSDIVHAMAPFTNVCITGIVFNTANANTHSTCTSCQQTNILN